jgi:type II secretory ATPase GspE/PulE/Tfp pilus assembly ATPase PilB-like protein
MERLCRKCREPIPAGRPTANDCGSPKCKSKAYRDRKRIAEDLADAKLLEEAMEAIRVSREINASAVKKARLQLEPQRIVLVCGCGARTTIQIAND